jgi:uncharacterized membrane protein (UPF0127 family)
MAKIDAGPILGEAGLGTTNSQKTRLEGRMTAMRRSHQTSSMLPFLAFGLLLPGAAATVRRGLMNGEAWVVFGKDTVVAEVARTTAERERGLMNRTEVPNGTGMIFIFSDAQIRTLWMSNTYVALDVAFFDANLTVVDIQQMEPETTAFHDSALPAMFALELPKGWLVAHQVHVGQRAELIFGPR